ncbi:MAG: hypothetical protein WDZ94_02995 [Patescibacteria group bacterium]
MVQRISVTPIVSLPQFTGWSHVIDVVTETNISCVIAIAVEGESAVSIGKGIVEDITAAPPRSAEALYQAFEDIIAQLSDLKCQCSLAGGVFRPGRSILATYHGSISLKRSDTVGEVLTSDASIEIIQGKAQLDDVFIFATLDAQQFLSAVALTYQKGFDTDSVVTSIVPAIHSLDASARCALGFAIVEEKNYSESEQKTGSHDKNVPDSEPMPSTEPISPTESTLTTDPTPPTEPLVEAQSETQSKPEPPTDTAAPSGSEVASDSPRVDARSESPNAKQPTALGTSEQAQSKMFEDGADRNLGVPPQKSRSKHSFPWKALFAKSWRVLVSLLGLVVRFLKNCKKQIAQLAPVLRQLIFTREYVPSQRIKRLRILLISIVGVSVVLGAVWFYLDWRYEAQQTEAQTIIEPYQARLDGVRAQASSDPVTAREESQGLLAALDEVVIDAENENKDVLLELAQQLRTDTQALVEAISGRDELRELTVAFDLRTVESSFIASSVIASDNQALVLDQEAQQGIVIDLQSDQMEAVDVSAVGSIESAVMRDASSAVFLAQGLYQMPLESSAEPALIIDEGDSNREGTLVGSFGPYLYVFNPDQRDIYRYLFDGSDFSDPIGWLIGPLGVSFEEVASWAIDGDIWIATQDGRIRKYTSGSQAEFAVSGLSEPFTGRLAIVTREEFENLYILESAQQRLVVLTKDGQFLREIKNVSLAAATDLFIQESTATAYVLSGSTIFSIPL